jgi:hypothetical protein
MCSANAPIRLSFQGLDSVSVQIAERRQARSVTSTFPLSGKDDVCERPRVRRGTRGRFNLCLPMKMAIVASTAPGNVWTTDEFAALVRENVTSLLNLGLDDLLRADDAELAPVNGGRTDLALHRHVRYRLDGQNIPTSFTGSRRPRRCMHMAIRRRSAWRHQRWPMGRAVSRLRLQ